MVQDLEAIQEQTAEVSAEDETLNRPFIPAVTVIHYHSVNRCSFFNINTKTIGQKNVYKCTVLTR